MKGKIKRAAVLACILLLCALAALCLAACAPDDEFAGEALAAGEVRVNVRDGQAIVRWGEEADADGYNVYASPSLYGEYEKVNEELLRAERFEPSGHAYDYFRIAAVREGEEEAIADPASAFGDETLIVAEGDDMAAVQRHIDDKHARLETGSTGQFSSERFAVMFLPGDYGELSVKVGYYTNVMGLGSVPGEVHLGGLYVSDKVLSNDNSTCTFWRGVENVAIDADTPWNGATVVRWAVSQATSMRRVDIRGDLALSTPSGWSSGGFLANSRVSGTVRAGTQQQWMSRNDEWAAWSGNSHNYVFSGCEGYIPAAKWSESGNRYTVIEQTEKIAEKPFLTCVDGEYAVFVPDVAEGTAGVTWTQAEAGTRIPLDDFYVANPDTDTAASINAALADGKHLLLTPGQYLLEEPLVIDWDDTVVLGMGYATLKIGDANAEGAVKVGDVGGVRLANLLIDAGAYCKNMVVIGETPGISYVDCPVVVSDLFLRIGGVENVHTETDTAMVINANDTIGDNFWIWRADHSRGVAWEDEYGEDGTVTAYGNPVQTGLLVNGDDVRCYALMVEHCEQYQTYWKGENGLTVMYQSETPYRVPSQDVYLSHNGTKNGYASYKVDDGVQTHRAYGLGVYLVQYDNSFDIDSAIEAPAGEGIEMLHMVTCSFSASGTSTINNVINDIGGPVGSNSNFRRLVERFPAA